MQPIYHRNGRVVGWFDSEVVYDLGGRARVFVKADAVFTYGAVYLGYMKTGFFRDRVGDAVAFLEGADGGPQLPSSRESPPHEPLAVPPASHPIPSLPPMPAMPSLGWSSVEWEGFLEGRM